jgi:hypothetical protein
VNAWVSIIVISKLFMGFGVTYILDLVYAGVIVAAQYHKQSTGVEGISHFTFDISSI